MDKTDAGLLEAVAGIHEIPAGAYNIRKNGELLSRASSANITIEKKEDKPGINIIVAPGTKNESVHIPVIITETGINDLVYNDFFIGEDSDVLIVAGCGIHNSGDKTSEHDGIHTFHIGKNSKVRYVEKHYGEGDGKGERILNPVTVVEQEENSVCEMEMVQIKGVDSTDRKTRADLAKGAKLIVTERLLTHGEQTAVSDIEINLNGEGAGGRIVSRSVAKGMSKQRFYYNATGNAMCQAHIQCDSIIMDSAVVSSTPAITANDANAQIIHEAAIGRINNDQLLKLMTFGMSEEEAEEVIIQGFLK
ncbi:MAG: SufD family Fe-S cluster assembly protein [Clostridiales bacterium]|nr:SufD family Fe-S cluster assembly protein [Clostridiales bacterium]